MLDAKCPHCSKRAEVDDEVSFVHCSSCNYHETYENYIETMKEKVQNMTNDYHIGWKKKK
ncbi:MAG TPA: zinc-domain-containing protein [Nitrososphaeraceae archaeon]